MLLIRSKPLGKPGKKNTLCYLRAPTRFHALPSIYLCFKHLWLTVNTGSTSKRSEPYRSVPSSFIFRMRFQARGSLLGIFLMTYLIRSVSCIPPTNAPTVSPGIITDALIITSPGTRYSRRKNRGGVRSIRIVKFMVLQR